MIRIAAGPVIAMLPLAGTFLYIRWRASYHPVAYEDAYQTLAVAAVASAGLLIAMPLLAILWSRWPPRRG